MGLLADVKNIAIYQEWYISKISVFKIVSYSCYNELSSNCCCKYTFAGSVNKPLELHFVFLIFVYSTIFYNQSN
jgi:hypothetical protein